MNLIGNRFEETKQLKQLFWRNIKQQLLTTKLMEDNSLKWNHRTDRNKFKTKSHQNQASWLDNVTNLKNCFFFARLPLISFLQYNINRTIRLIDPLTPSLQIYNIFIFVRSSKYRSFLASSPHLPTIFRNF